MDREPGAGPLPISVVITVVGGRPCTHRCLSVLDSQVRRDGGELIVPYDGTCLDVGELRSEFPHVLFPEVPDGDPQRSNQNRPADRQHDRYDRRRSVGLAFARGTIIAMTEDYAVPADDWCRRHLDSHSRSDAGAIGGPIENGVDRSLNRAWYYCDFGRYGRPVSTGPADYVSDVNVSYKREALERVRDVWANAYQETLVHWAMRRRGLGVVLESGPVVWEHRPDKPWIEVIKERVEWGCVFAETFKSDFGRGRGWLRSAATPMLPFVLGRRALGHMRRQGCGGRRMLSTLVWLVPMLAAWTLGEFAGYVTGPTGHHRAQRVR